MASYIFQYTLVFLSAYATNGTPTGPSLKQVQSLETTMNHLQKQIQVQEQANAKVLTDILSQLASTSSQLNAVTSNYTALETELEALKHDSRIKEQGLEAEISLLKDELKDATSNYTSLESELEGMKQSTSLKDQAQGAEITALRDQLKEITSNYTTLESELEAVKQTYRIKEHAQEAEIATLKGNLTTINKQVNVLTTAVLHLQFYQQAQSIHDKKQDVMLNSTQTDLNTTLSELVDLQANVSSLEVELETINRTCIDQLLEQEKRCVQIVIQLNNTDSLVNTLDREYSSLKSEMDGLSSNCSSIGNEVELATQAYIMIAHDVTNLTTDFEYLEKEIFGMQKKMLSNSRLNSTIYGLEGDIRALETNMTSSLFTITQEISALQKASTSKDRNSTNVAFETSPAVTASGSKDYGTDETIIFSQPLYNEGNGYDTATGRFTAPVSGSYLFWVNFAFTNHSSILIQMKKNGTYFGSVYGALSSRTSSGSTSGVNGVILKKGDVVTFSSSTPTTMLDGLCWLGGALVHESL